MPERATATKSVKSWIIYIYQLSITINPFLIILEDNKLIFYRPVKNTRVKSITTWFVKQKEYLTKFVAHALFPLKLNFVFCKSNF
jgi:hypothetical protein